MATTGDVPKLGFGAGAAHFVVTLGFGAAPLGTPDATVGLSPTWSNSLYKPPTYFKPPRYSSPRWRPPDWKAPW